MKVPGVRTEAAAVAVGGHSHSPLESSAQRFGGAEPAVASNDVEWRVALFELGTCGFDAHTLHVSRRRLADFGEEDAAEVPGAHRRPVGEQIDAMVSAGMSVDELLRGAQR